MIVITLNILAVAALLFGLFFLFIGALGLWRLPDVYNRMHAASKCTTLGVSGVLIAAVLYLGAMDASPGGEVSMFSVITRAALVIVFQFTAAPVGAHMLARAAHVDGAAKWEGTLGDELADDRPPPPPVDTAG